MTTTSVVAGRFLASACVLFLYGCHFPVMHPAQTAVLLKTLANPYWSQMAAGIRREAARRGISVDIYAAEDEDDLQGQQMMMDDLVSKKYKVIAVAPITPVNLIEPTSRATREGILVIDLDESMNEQLMRAEDTAALATVATDNRALGGKAAQFILDHASDRNMDVAVIAGRAGSPSSDDRVEGALNVFGNSKNVSVIAVQPADWDRERALSVANAMLTRDPKLAAIYAANDTMALGAEKAVRINGRSGTVLVVGTDGSPEALSSIRSGELSATVAQDPTLVGATAVDLMTDALAGKLSLSAPREITIDSHLITRTTEQARP